MARFRLMLLILALIGITISGQAQGQVYRAAFTAAGHTLIVEVLDDDLVHFELTTAAEGATTPIETSLMIAKTDYPGATSLEFPSADTIQTPEMRIVVDTAVLCVTVTDRTRQPELTLTTICPMEEGGALNGLSFAQSGTTDIYGLGERFRARGGTDGTWLGERRMPGNQYGNAQTGFNGGNVANAQFPILYALGEGTNNYAAFIDSVAPLGWSFTADPFTMMTRVLPLRWYVMTGSDLRDLHADYMELTGSPPVPPQQMFGLWVSEYGFDDWDELFSVLESMREENFPLDGFVLDLLWFGGIESGASQMGALAWDEEAFPDPAAYIAQLRDEYGIGIMTIEEPYLSETARGYAEARAAGVMVPSCAGCDPVHFDEWWGIGGMVDFTNPEAAAWWHDQRRQHLIDAGVMAHWTDLGEPEDYDPSGYYYGGADHASIHNLYNLFWSQSVWQGYQRNEVERRPFILSRSGTSGSQRYGVAMWSGDIAANLASLTEQMNVQMHMSLSGIDYFGSDVGGFFRQSFDPMLGMDGMYTLWYANSALTDVPLRPHAFNIQNLYATAPSLVGDLASNRANTRLRYQLSPYLYSLAHLAYRASEPVFPPLVYYFQEDPAARTLGGQKMIGSQMMMTALTDYTPELTSVYLPSGGWFNFRTGEYVESAGESIEVAPTIERTAQAPLFVRDGAVIPLMRVDDQTLNTLGQRTDGTVDNSIVFNVYHAAQDGAFTLIEDDGETMAYQSGAIRETRVEHHAVENGIAVTISAANGSYSGAPDAREIEIHLISPTITINQVMINGEPLPEMTAAADYGWMIDESGVVIVRAGVLSVGIALTVTFAG